MKVYRDLIITSNASELPTIRQCIENLLPSGWERDKESEEQLSEHATCFRRNSAKGRRGIIVMLYETAGDVHVANLLPLDGKDLSADQYNRYVEEFYMECVVPALKGTSAKAELGKTEKGIEDYMSPQTTAKLKRFSTIANKSTGTTHVRDQEYWHDFVIAVHRERAELAAETLARWLTENEGWSDEIASDIAEQYEQERALLDRYDVS